MATSYDRIERLIAGDPVQGSGCGCSREFIVDLDDEGRRGSVPLAPSAETAVGG